jgi:hypothetical protein
MIALLWLFLTILSSPFKPRCRLEVDNTTLRHQLMVLQRQARDRIRLTNLERLFLVQLYRWFPSILRVLAIVQPETVIRGIGLAFAATGVGSRVRGRAAAARWRATRSDPDRSIEAARRPDPNFWLQKMCANFGSI